MYYQNYEDYMRSVLGYPIVENQDTYQRNIIEETQNYILPNQNTKELEECYPEIYKLLEPIVGEVCSKCTVPVTREILENMVEEVYQKVENNNEILVNIQIENRNQEQEVENRTNNNVRMNSNRNSANQIVSNQTMQRSAQAENRQRRPNNPLLRDLIRILILNQLLGGNFPNRPPRPRPPYPRPPFPGEPRPPYRDYENYLK